MGSVTYNATSTATVLSLVKTTLGISTTAFDTAITNDISYARTELGNKGLVLDETDPTKGAADIQIVVMYSTWLWNKRESGAEMPRMLVVAINDRFTHQIMQNVTAGA